MSELLLFLGAVVSVIGTLALFVVVRALRRVLDRRSRRRRGVLGRSNTFVADERPDSHNQLRSVMDRTEDWPVRDLSLGRNLDAAVAMAVLTRFLYDEHRGQRRANPTSDPEDVLKARQALQSSARASTHRDLLLRRHAARPLFP